ncbi:MAG: ribokinase [Deltaproteobacteria bacterium]|nr:ribokinase [Deltaproteobacteria bacterium]
MTHRVAVVGHVEWVRFLQVDGAPSPGAILRSAGERLEPAGGGGAAAADLARLAGGCLLVTALGSDPLGQRIPAHLARHGVRVVGPTRAEAHRQAVTLLDPDGERTIVVVGPAQWATGAEVDPATFDDLDAVYFCKGDAPLLRAARRARVLVATARVLDVVRASGVRLDALVHSASDPSERYRDGDLLVPPALVATTDGARGGAWRTASAAGRWDPAPLPGPRLDAYGAGDSFAAGLAWALASALAPPEALALAATRGAAALCRVGAGTP